MRFGGLVAVSDFNLNLEKGQIVGLIGPNGSGKTTVFNVITGFYKPTEGQLLLEGKEDHRPLPRPHHSTGTDPHLPEQPRLPGVECLR